MKISTSIITFRVDIDFDKADVDMVYQEARAAGYSGVIPHVLTKRSKHTVENNETPTSESVDFCLDYLMGCARQISRNKWEIRNSIETLPIFKKLGVTVVEKHGLMQGTSYVIFEVDRSRYSYCLVKRVQKEVEKVFRRFVRYYKKGSSITV